MVIARGLSMLITQGTPLSLFTLPPTFKFIGQGTIDGVPFVIVIFVVIALIFDVLLRRATVFRRFLYTGSNEQAARYSGINVKRVKFGATVLCSGLAGLAGVIYMARFGSATPTFGVGMELNVIAAAVIGGASSLEGLGRHFGGQFYEAEARYLVASEWAQRADDILYRRTKHYLHLTPAERAAFADWFDTARPAAA